MADLDAVLGSVRRGRIPPWLEFSVKQELWLLLDQREAFFGGAAGPGKSWGLLAAGLQYADVPGYHALLLRPALTEFELPGGLIDVAHDWLGGTDARWNGGNYTWRFPTPNGAASLTFGYLSSLADISRYKGTNFQFVGWDELTGFSELMYRRMFRVLRKPKHAERFGPAPDGLRISDVPLRTRAASNPGGPGHSWVKARLIDEQTRKKSAVYIKARLQDNPFINVEEYIESLSELDPTERERLLAGDWDVMEEGTTFKREWFPVVDHVQGTRAVRWWDLAATEPSASNPDPDWSVGLRLELDEATGVFAIRHIARFREEAGETEKTVRRIAEEDGPAVPVWMEQEPGSSGKALVAHYKRNVLRGYACYGKTSSGDKEVRARPVAAAAQNGLVQLARGPHVLDFLDEVSLFPKGGHDDMVDALSGAHSVLSLRGGPVRSAVPRRRIPSPGWAGSRG